MAMEKRRFSETNLMDDIVQNVLTQSFVSLGNDFYEVVHW